MDTTAKVDIRKLQLLNDRIAQTIDALNQVRLSVHGLGLSHTAAGIPGASMASPFQSGFQGSSFPYSATSAYNQPVYGSWPGASQGISHSNPWAQSAYAQSAGFAQPHLAGIYGQQQVNPLLAQLLWQQGLSGGLSHTSDVWGSAGLSGVGHPYGSYPSAAGVDPFTASRMMQMFPFAQMPVSPVG